MLDSHCLLIESYSDSFGLPWGKAQFVTMWNVLYPLVIQDCRRFPQTLNQQSGYNVAGHVPTFVLISYDVSFLGVRISGFSYDVGHASYRWFVTIGS